MSDKYLGVMFMDNAAIRKAGKIEGWMPYEYQHAEGGIIVKGCMTASKVNGDNKGEPKFLFGIKAKTVIVTKADRDRERDLYESSGCKKSYFNS